MEDCVFCKIVAGEITTELIYSDDDIIAFRDHYPAAPVHLLIVPRKHIPTLADCTETEAPLIGKMLLLAPKLAAQTGCAFNIEKGGHKSGGFKTMFNTGPDGGQQVYHLHLHVVGGPRPWRGGTRLA